MDKIKLQDWEYALKSAIYLSLIGYRESSGYSIPCKTRGEIEDVIITRFKNELARTNYNVPTKKV